MKRKSIRLEDVVLKPVTSLIERFNMFLKNMETKEKVSEVDGFVSGLLDELKDIEKGILGFFAEILFMYHLLERMVSIENEISLVEILGEKTKEFLKPEFIKIYLKTSEEKVSSAYSYPDNFENEVINSVIEKSLNKGESFLYEKKINGKFYSILSIPLRTTKEKYGIFITEKGKKVLLPRKFPL
ncbi:MAG: hypothetical protein ACPLZ9_04435 [Candidatus Ratteibacteria bacterium]